MAQETLTKAHTVRSGSIATRTATAVMVIMTMLAVVFASPASGAISDVRLDWARSIGGSGFDFGNAIAVDSAGNTHITGQFENTMDIDAGPGVATVASNGRTDGFVAVHDPAGNLIWAHTFGDVNADRGVGIATDAAGNTHVTGSFEGTIDVDPSANEFNLTSNGRSDAFVAVYGSTGNLLWAHSFGDPAAFDTGFAIAADASGNTHLAAGFSGTVDVDPSAGEFNLTSNGSRDALVAVYGPTGSLIWAKSFGNTGLDQTQSIATDSTGNTHVTGRFSRTIDLDPTTPGSTLTSTGDADVFVAVYDPTGSLIWTHSFGGTAFDEGRGIATDAAGNTHVTGNFRETVDVDPGTGVLNISAGDSFDNFVVVYDPTGSPIWATNLATNVAESIAVAADPDGNTHIVGQFTGSFDVDPGNAVFDLTTGFFDAFAAVFDPTGNLVWATNIGELGDVLFGLDVATDATAARTRSERSMALPISIRAQAKAASPKSAGSTSSSFAIHREPPPQRPVMASR